MENERKSGRQSKSYSQADFDERDLRILTAEIQSLKRRFEGAAKSETDIIEMACSRIGITFYRAQRVLSLTKSDASQNKTALIEQARREEMRWSLEKSAYFN